MRKGPELRTGRLLLRRWRDADRAPFAAMNADPEVMAHFPDVLSRERSNLMVDRIEAAFERDGCGLWALEIVESGRFIGFAGLNEATFDAHFTPAVEIGWRLARPAWGYGYATEAARVAMAFGFDTMGFDEIVSFTSATNTRSEAVMRRLGMLRDPSDDFEHPAVPLGHQLRRHVLYRISAQRFALLRAATGDPGAASRMP